MGVYSKRERERERCRSGSSRKALGDTGGRQRVGEGDEHSRRLFVADEFAGRPGECRMCSREEDKRLEKEKVTSADEQRKLPRGR
jgi:hypothetical protein